MNSAAAVAVALLTLVNTVVIVWQHSRVNIIDRVIRNGSGTTHRANGKLP